ARHVAEAHLHVVFGVDLGAAPRKRHDPAFRAANPPEEEAPDGDEEDERNDPAEHLRQPSADCFAAELHAGRFEIPAQLRVLDEGGDEAIGTLPALALSLAQPSADALIADGDLDDLIAPQQ